MKVAIMQPYVFPYVGYFQLIYATDNFVFYDDVDFIKGGWVNRNKILINNTESLFTIPLKKASSFKLINETEVHPALYGRWKKKFLKSVNQSYNKAPYFDQIFQILEDLLNKVDTISDLAINGVKKVCEYLELERNFYISSIDFPKTKGLERAERIIDITKKLGATNYINMPGGKELYDKTFFEKREINLEFIEPYFSPYDQNKAEFTAGLSIIDVLMFCSKSEVLQMIKEYRIE